MAESERHNTTRIYQSPTYVVHKKGNYIEFEEYHLLGYDTV
jgi:hypothetical protein